MVFPASKTPSNSCSYDWGNIRGKSVWCHTVQCVCERMTNPHVCYLVAMTPVLSLQLYGVYTALLIVKTLASFGTSCSRRRRHTMREWLSFVSLNPGSGRKAINNHLSNTTFVSTYVKCSHSTSMFSCDGKRCEQERRANQKDYSGRPQMPMFGSNFDHALLAWTKLACDVHTMDVDSRELQIVYQTKR